MANRNVIAYATNITMKSRRAIMEKLNNAEVDCHKIAYVMTKDWKQCFEDNLNREHPVPEEVINKQIHKFQIPFYEEGFDEIVLHKTNETTTITSFFIDLTTRMDGWDQLTPYHTLDLLSHCEKAAIKFREKIGYDWSEYALASKLHDIGKLFTQTFDEEAIAHYYNHENVGCYYLLSNEHHFRNLGYTDDEILNVLFLVNYHMMPFSWTSEKAHRTWKRRFGKEKYQLLLDFNECDRNAK